jgi:hypothetical protein
LWLLAAPRLISAFRPHLLMNGCGSYLPLLLNLGLKKPISNPFDGKSTVPFVGLYSR